MSDQAYSKVQAQQKTLSESSSKSNLLQRTCACGQHTIAGAECSTCRGEQSTLQRFQRAFEPPSAPGVVPGSSPALEHGTSFNPAFDRASRFRHDFSQIPVHVRPEAEAIASEQHGSWSFGDKSVDGKSDNRVGLVEDKGPDGGVGPKGAGPPTAPAKMKKVGVDSFEVKWKKNPLASSTVAKLRLDYSVKFKKDDMYDPAKAEFRQNAFHTFECTAGPHKGQKNSNSPLHDDNYSRADDDAGRKLSDVNFASNDNPGASPLDKDDVIDYSFTAEQMIIDTSDSNKVIAKRGPHTATIKGKDPRTFDGVPKVLS